MISFYSARINLNFVIINLRIISVIGIFISQALASTKVSENLENYLKPLARKSDSKISALFYDPIKKEPIYGLNANLALTPASSVKILTAMAALKKWGPDYRFKTEVFRYKNNIYIRGNGDPSMVTERLYLFSQWLSRLLKSEQSVSPPLYFDATLWGGQSIPSSRIDTDSKRAYNAAVGALTLNYNSLSVYVSPGNKTGAPALTSVDVPLPLHEPFIQIRNQTITSGHAHTAFIDLHSLEQAGNKHITVTSTGKVAHEKVKYFSVHQPAEHFASALCGFMEQEAKNKSSELCKKRAFQALPEGAIRLGEFEGLPLREIIILMNKFSNNAIADTLATALSEKIPATLAQGLERMKETALNCIPKPSNGFKLVSGSGLTEDNLMSASDFIELIKCAENQKDYWPELLSSFPILGVDGTLRKKNGNKMAALRAKTGSLDNAQSLVGVAYSVTGAPTYFSIIANGTTFSAEKVAAILQELE